MSIQDGCIKCELCEGNCSKVFRMNGDGLAEVYAQPNRDEEDTAYEATDGCPVSIIKIEN